MDSTFHLTLNAEALGILHLLSDAQQGKLLMALAAYAANGRFPDFNNRTLTALFHALAALLRNSEAAPEASTPDHREGEGGREREGDKEGEIKRENKGEENNYLPNPLKSPYPSFSPSPASPLPPPPAEANAESEKTANAATVAENADAKPHEFSAQANAAPASTIAAEPAPHDFPDNPAQTRENYSQAGGNSSPQTSDSSPQADEPTDEECAFDAVWRLYDKDVGDMTYLRSRWAQIALPERRRIVRYLREYVRLRPTRKYRRNFRNFLDMRIWETEPLEQIAAANAHSATAACHTAEAATYRPHYDAQPAAPTRESILREMERVEQERRKKNEMALKLGRPIVYKDLE